jgi:hypothetical protein
MSTSIYVPSADEFTGSGADYGMLSEDEYRVRIDSYKRVNRVSQYNPDGNETIDFILKPLGFADDEDADLVDDKGNQVNPEKHLIFFYDPQRLGVRPQIAKSRKFLAAAMNIPADGPIALPGGYDELVGKEIIAHVGIRNGRNYVIDTRPIRKRARVRTNEAAPVAKTKSLVDKARETFDIDEEAPF